MMRPAVVPPPAVFRAALKVWGRLHDLLERAVPAAMAVVDLTWGVQRTAVAAALVTSGLADALGDRACDPGDVAKNLGLDADVTSRVLAAAAAARLVTWDRGGLVSLSRLGAPLRRDHPSSVAAWVAGQGSPVVLSAYAQLDAQLRGGAEPSGIRRASGASLWDHFSAHPAEGVRFGDAMRETTGLDLAALTRGYPWPRRGVICDVAGGTGTLLAAILEHRPGLRGILIDAAEVVAEAGPFLRSRGVADRVECRAGDLFADIDAHADVYIMKWILHDWSDAACRDILRQVRATMQAGSKIVAIDQHLEPHGANPVASTIDVHMLAMCEGGRERTPDQVHTLMREAGLTPGEVRHAGLHMFVEGVA